MTHCQSLIQTLRGQGYRITPQREMIVEALAHGGDHMTAEEIYTQVMRRTRSVNIATVYRTLDMLIQAGLASRAWLDDGQQVFATHLHGPHIHLVCRSCGGVSNIDSDALLPLVEHLISQYGFEVNWQHLSIAGICQNCRNKKL